MHCCLLKGKGWTCKCSSRDLLYLLFLPSPWRRPEESGPCLTCSITLCHLEKGTPSGGTIRKRCPHWVGKSPRAVCLNDPLSLCMKKELPVPLDGNHPASGRMARHGTSASVASASFSWAPLQNPQNAQPSASPSSQPSKSIYPSTFLPNSLCMMTTYSQSRSRKKGMELGFRGQSLTLRPLMDNGANGFPHPSDINLGYPVSEQSDMGWWSHSHRQSWQKIK